MEEGAACPGGLGEALSPHLPHAQAPLPQTAEVLVRRPTPGLRRPPTDKALQGLRHSSHFGMRGFPIIPAARGYQKL